MSQAALFAARMRTIESMAPMLRTAEVRGLFLFSRYRSLWFTPQQLKEEWKRGRFIWGPSQWQLRDASGKGVAA